MRSDKEKGTQFFGRPSRLPDNQLKPILFLADTLSQVESRPIPKNRRMVDMLADVAGMANFRHQPWCRDMTMDKAMEQLKSPIAKHVTMLVLTLILKTDAAERSEAREGFTKIRLAMDCGPVKVPGGVVPHTKLVVGYFHKLPGM